MAKKPSRTWAMVASLGSTLAIVGVSAMAISYATLIDVARVNGLPLPELFPVLVDVGTVATMIAAAQFRMRGVPGRWLAYTTFILLSGVSIVANATHAGRAADLTVTSPWAAAILASTPPAVLLAITHLVMMMIPDEKERAKLQSLRERAERVEAMPMKRNEPLARPESARAVEPSVRRSAPAVESRPAVVPASAEPVEGDTEPVPVQGRLRLVDGVTEPSDAEVKARVLEFLDSEGKRPTGAVVGEWLGGKTPKTGQRFLKKMDDDGLLELATAEERMKA
ncbi:hypothetical protein D3248_01640 [Leucobacter zeae]|nr:hypothetical protein [Leucobacter zeae]